MLLHYNQYYVIAYPTVKTYDLNYVSLHKIIKIRYYTKNIKNMQKYALITTIDWIITAKKVKIKRCK